jgi:hypothetical protein
MSESIAETPVEPKRLDPDAIRRSTLKQLGDLVRTQQTIFELAHGLHSPDLKKATEQVRGLFDIAKRFRDCPISRPKVNAKGIATLDELQRKVDALARWLKRMEVSEDSGKGGAETAAVKRRGHLPQRLARPQPSDAEIAPVVRALPDKFKKPLPAADWLQYDISSATLRRAKSDGHISGDQDADGNNLYKAPEVVRHWWPKFKHLATPAIKEPVKV